MTQNKEELPLMGDFEESSLLDQIRTKEEEDEEQETEEEKAARLKEEAEEQETPEEKEARLKAKEEEEETDEEKEIRLAKEQEEELTDEERAALKKNKEEQGSFWEDVEAITGNTIEVDFGDVNPDSPEGAALREDAVVSQAIEANLSSLEKNYPKSFAALQHESNGGSFEDLLNPETTHYSDITLDKDNEEQLKGVLKNYYLSKGLPEAKAQRNVEDDEDSDEGLFVNAEAALKEQQQIEIAAKEKVILDQEEEKRLQGEQDKKFTDNLSAIIAAGAVGNFKVPKAEAEKFYNHVLSQVQRDGRGYRLSIPLTNENFTEQLQQLFFGFKGGDLSKYVTKAAKTVATRSLKRNVKKEKTAEEVAEETRIDTSKLPTMGDFSIEEKK